MDHDTNHSFFRSTMSGISDHDDDMSSMEKHIHDTVPLSVRLTVLCVNLILNNIILVPILVLYCCRFRKLTTYDHLLIIQKRYPSIIKVSCALTVFVLLVERSLYSFLNGCFYELVNMQVIHSLWRVQIILYAAFNIIILLGLWRYWHVFYDLQMAHVSCESEWKRYLNSQLTHDNWFANHKNTFGSRKYTKTLLYATIVVVTLLRTTLFQYFMFGALHNFIQVFDAFLYLVPVLSIWALAFKAPAMQDMFGMRQEMHYYSIITFVGLVCYIAVVVLHMANVINEYYMLLYVNMLATLCIWGVAVLQTAWIVYKIDHDPNYNDTQRRSSSNVFGGIPQAFVGCNSKSVVMYKYISASDDHFQLFMTHVQQEFSLELLLFFIEVHQYKGLLRKSAPVLTSRQSSIVRGTKGVKDSEDYEALFDVDGYVIAVPKSQIVFQLFRDLAPNLSPTKSMKLKVDAVKTLPEFVVSLSGKRDVMECDNLDKLKAASHLLYLRYVKEYSELEINISCECRRRLTDALGNVNHLVEHTQDIGITELYHIFDEAICQCLKLLMQSFGRFKRKIASV